MSKFSHDDDADDDRAMTIPWCSSNSLAKNAVLSLRNGESAVSSLHKFYFFVKVQKNLAIQLKYVFFKKLVPGHQDTNTHVSEKVRKKTTLNFRSQKSTNFK